MNRRLYLSLFMTILATTLGVSLVVPLLPVYARTLGANGLELGLIFSAFSLSRGLILPIVGQVAEKWGRKKFMLWGLAIYTLVSFAFTLADSVWILILCRLIQGGAAALVIPVARAYVGELALPGREGRMMGHFNMAFFGGLALGPAMGGVLKDHFGLDSTFLSMGAMSFIGFILSVVALPPSKKDRPKEESTTTYWTLLGLPLMASLFLFRFGSIIGVGMSWSFLPLFGHEALKLSSSQIGFLVSINVIMTTVLQPYFGKLADRISRPLLTVLGGALASICLLGVPFCQTFNHMFIINLLMGMAIGLYMPPLMAMSVDVGRESGFMTRVMSLLEMAFSFGMVVGPMMAGTINELFGLRAIFWVGGGLGLISCLAFWPAMHLNGGKRCEGSREPSDLF